MTNIFLSYINADVHFIYFHDINEDAYDSWGDKYIAPNTFYTKFLRNINTIDFYCFVICDYQEEDFRERLKKYNIEDSIIWKSPKTFNLNYLEDGPKMTFYILKFKESPEYYEQFCEE